MNAAGGARRASRMKRTADSTITIAGTEEIEIKQRIIDIMGVTEAEVDAAFADTEAIGLPRGMWKAGCCPVPTRCLGKTRLSSRGWCTIDELDRSGVAPKLTVRPSSRFHRRR